MLVTASVGDFMMVIVFQHLIQSTSQLDLTAYLSPTWNVSDILHQLCSQRNLYQTKNRFKSDQYRDTTRARALELISWILDSGDHTRLGLTREDVVVPLREKTANPPFEESDEDLDELNAHRRAENWIRRFNQQNYQAWNTTKGRPYVELGNI